MKFTRRTYEASFNRASAHLRAVRGHWKLFYRHAGVKEADRLYKREMERAEAFWELLRERALREDKWPRGY